MCGIAGIVNLDRGRVDDGILKDMAYVQSHRGPDDMGIYSNENVGLAHRRLSIIDLSGDAHQPMVNENSGAVIVHNGEIYNYRELRRELESLGHRFKSKSDTEVILRAYEEWDKGCLDHFNGMWSFAIFDIKKMIMFCARDRFGVKPFYYYLDARKFIFSSEIKAILRHPGVRREQDDQSIFNYLASGYGYMDISNHTFFNGIKQLKPGHYIKLSIREKALSQTKYWDINPNKKSYFKNEDDIYTKFHDLFEDSVRLRLRSDVPIGVSLSGGLDSSSIACVAAKLLGSSRLETFSSCFDDIAYDERRFISTVIEKTGANSNLVFTRPERLFDDMKDILWHQDEPYSTLSIFPQWYIMKLAKERGVKVMLTGQGGDETLAGYHKYYLYLFADLIYSMRFKKAFNEIKIYKRTQNNSRSVFFPITRIMLSYSIPKILKDFFRPAADKSILSCLNKDFLSEKSASVFTEKKFDRILNNDLYNALKISPLPSLLHIDDRSSMAHSVESRAPFLDFRLVEFVFSLDPEYKIHKGLTKYVLRRSLDKLLPNKVKMRRDKMGFATPLEKWLRTNLRDKVYDIFSSREFSARPYFDQKNVLKKFNNFADGKEPGGYYAIWSWVNLELWFRRFIDSEL